MLKIESPKEQLAPSNIQSRPLVAGITVKFENESAIFYVFMTLVFNLKLSLLT